MKISYKDVGNKGAIIAQYTFTRTYGAITALVLGELSSEYNYACEHNLNLGRVFLTSIERLVEYIGIDYDELHSALKELSNDNLIKIEAVNIEGSMRIRFEVENILNTKLELEEDCSFGEWDKGLVSCLNPINKKNYFSPSTIAIKNILYNNLNNFLDVLAVTYSEIDSIIKEYEDRTSKKIYEMKNLESLICKKLKNSKDSFSLNIDLLELVIDICSENKS
jgi:hypothetical protein